MNFLRNTLSCIRSSNFIRNQNACFHSTPFRYNILSQNCATRKFKELLVPTPSVLNHSRGMKYKNVVKKRCDHCYIIWKDGRKFNYCKVRPRHNHASIVLRDKWRFIITHRTYGKLRGW